MLQTSKPPNLPLLPPPPTRNAHPQFHRIMTEQVTRGKTKTRTQTHLLIRHLHLQPNASSALHSTPLSLPLPLFWGYIRLPKTHGERQLNPCPHGEQDASLPMPTPCNVVEKNVGNRLCQNATNKAKKEQENKKEQLQENASCCYCCCCR